MNRVQSIRDIASAYDKWARTYESVENATRDMASRVLQNQSLNLRGCSILEIGCGTGLNTRFLAQHASTMYAVDFSRGMLREARANVSATNVRFVQCDIQSRWPLTTASLDCIICTLVLEHIADLDHIFSEASRILHSGGEFFICELHPFRQLQGRQAQFTDADSGNQLLVQAYLHDVSDYVNGSIKQGFHLERMDEWRDEADITNVLPPRLLSLQLRL